MARSYVEYTASGGSEDLSVSFTTTTTQYPYGYISRSHVKVALDGVDASFTWVNDGTVRVTTVAGQTVRIYRDTPYAPLVDFSSGSNVLKSDLNKAATQAEFKAEELRDHLERCLQVDDFTDGYNADMDIPDPAALSYVRRNAANTAWELVASDPSIPVGSSVITHSSVANAKADTSLVVGMYVATTGYYSAGDGGGASYVVVAGGTGTDDGGEYHDTAGGLQLRLVHKGDVNVRWWGAKGDNSTNDTAAIQAAIDAITTDGGRVFVPEGIYRHTGIDVPSNVSIVGEGPKSSILRLTSGTANGITLSGTGRVITIASLKLDCLTSSSGAGIYSAPATAVTDLDVYNYEIEGYLKGLYIPFGLQIRLGMGRLIGQGTATAGGIGVQFGDLDVAGTIVNVAWVDGCYCSTFETSYNMDGSIHNIHNSISEAATYGIDCGSRLTVIGCWVQATTHLYSTKAGGYPITSIGCYHLNGASAEQDDVSGMVDLGTPEDLGVYNKCDIKSAGKSARFRFATSAARGVQVGSGDVSIWESGGSMRVSAAARPLEVDRLTAGAVSLFAMRQNGSAIGGFGVDGSGQITALGSGFSAAAAAWDNSQNFQAGAGALGTTATDGFLYIPSCAGVPTGTPTTKTGFVPIVADSTNNKLYIYSGGSWVALN